jgi:hypothetical protein
MVEPRDLLGSGNIRASPDHKGLENDLADPGFLVIIFGHESLCLIFVVFRVKCRIACKREKPKHMATRD